MSLINPYLRLYKRLGYTFADEAKIVEALRYIHLTKKIYKQNYNKKILILGDINEEEKFKSYFMKNILFAKKILKFDS